MLPCCAAPAPQPWQWALDVTRHPASALRAQFERTAAARELCSEIVALLNTSFEDGEGGSGEPGMAPAELFTTALQLLDEGSCCWLTVHVRRPEAAPLLAAVMATARFSDRVHVVNLAVGREFRGCGIARYLLREAEAEAAERGMRFVGGHVDRSRPDLLALYDHLGAHPAPETGHGCGQPSVAKVALPIPAGRTAANVRRDQVDEWLRGCERRRAAQQRRRVCCCLAGLAASAAGVWGLYRLREPRA
eukprot:TRINITY_DN52740_c0_g1_i1.p1 TRINITY_DN52740_c0_g1~~TRINITY_DN52740_c0_g1_i1.p1  ORF type:complete len:248 (+),score=48.37 TRINITY_DN52740_c0_g1_i1:86-829(+)